MRRRVDAYNEGSQVVHVCNAAAVGFRCRKSLFPLLAVVEALSHPEVLDLVWHSVLLEGQCTSGQKANAVSYVRVVGKVRPGLISGGGGGGGLPARDIDGIEVRSHLSDHDRIQAAIGEASFLAAEALFYSTP